MKENIKTAYVITLLVLSPIMLTSLFLGFLGMDLMDAAGSRTPIFADLVAGHLNNKFLAVFFLACGTILPTIGLIMLGLLSNYISTVADIVGNDTEDNKSKSQKSPHS